MNAHAATLPDHANEPDARGIAIDRVGIKGLRYPIRVMDRDNETQHTVADVALSVGLREDMKGTHMSRFVEILHAERGEMTLRKLPGLLEDIQRRLGAEDAYIELDFPYFMQKRAPVSGVESLMEYGCTFRASRRGSTVDFVLVVRVPVKSLCPCSKAVSERGAHNQRSHVNVEVRSTSFVWIEDIVGAVEACASAPLYALLKREDEKYVTELAYDNPKFVEDLVRDCVIAVRALPGVAWLRVSAENQESIHNHAAFAQIEWSPDEPARATDEGVVPRVPDAACTFAEWLRTERTRRNVSQTQFAELLGMSPAHMSRVERGEKRLSEDALRRVAELLDRSPDEVALRAGVVPEHLLARIAERPGAFLEWASAR